MKFPISFVGLLLIVNPLLAQSIPGRPAEPDLLEASAPWHVPPASLPRHLTGTGTTAEPAWTRFYSSGAASPEDRALDAAVDAEGNLYLTGFSTTTEAKADYLTVALDANGDVRWTAQYDEEGFDDAARAVTLGPDGSVYVTGHTTRTASGRDATTVKYDNEGNEIWSVRFEEGDGYSLDVVVGADGSVYVCAYLGRQEGSLNDLRALIKYDAEGNELWVNRFEMVYFAPSNPLALDTDGNAYVVGREWDEGSNYALLIKYAPDGRELRKTRYSPENELASIDPSAALVNGDGNLYITGMDQSNAQRAFLVKYDPDGNKLWERFDDALRWGFALDVDEEGSVYVTGGHRYPEEEYRTAKYDAVGNRQWITLPSQIRPSKIIAGNDGEVYVSGSFTPVPLLKLSVANNPSSLTVETFDAASGLSLNLVSYSDGLTAGDPDPTPLLAQSSGRLYLIGNRVGDKGDTDFLAIQYDEEGEEKWTTAYSTDGRNDVDLLVSHIVAGDAGVVLGATSRSDTDIDYLISKYDANGTPLWHTRHDEGGREQLTAFTVDSSGYVYATGSFDKEANASSRDVGYLTVKLDPEGEVVWSRKRRFQINQTIYVNQIIYISNFSGQHVAVDTEGNVLVAGKSYVEDAFLLIKYDAAGNQLWEVAVPKSRPDLQIRGFGLDANGNAYIAWDDFSDYVIAKYDSDGRPLWTARYAIAASSQSVTLAIRPNGEVLLNGLTRGGNEHYCTTVKLNADGREQWSAVLDFDASEAGHTLFAISNIAVDSEGNAVSTCRETVVKQDAEDGHILWSHDTGYRPGGLALDEADNVFVRPSDFATEKRYTRLDKEGRVTWSDQYVASSGTIPPTLVTFDVDGSGDIYVAAWVDGTEWRQIGLFKFEPETPVPVEETPPVPAALALNQNHPNPFSGTTQITYTLPAPTAVRLAVYDVLGRRVATLAEGRRPAGTHRATFAADGRLAGGVYFYRLETGGQVETRRMVVLP